MDSFERLNWNLLQVLAWVYLGDRGLVQRLADGAWSDRSFNQEQVRADGRKELVKTSANPPSFLTIEIVAARSGATIETAIEGTINGVDFPVDEVRSAYASMEMAEEAVLAPLQDGSLTAFGFRNGVGERDAVPALQWVDLTFDDNPPRAVPHDATRKEAPEWHDLTFRRKDVLALWPDPMQSADVSSSTMETNSAKRDLTEGFVAPAELNRWYKSTYVPSFNSSERRPNREEDLQAAREHFRKLVPDQMVRNARREHAPEKWKKAGAPKKLTE